MTVNLPNSYNYGLVVGRVIHAVADSTDDVDRAPEARPASGTVRFEPTTKLRKILVAPTTFVGHETVTATLGPTGELLDAEGEVGIWLIEGTYNVTFSIVGASIPPFAIEVTAAHTALAPLDLVTAAPYIAPAAVPVNLIEVPAGSTTGTVLGWGEAGPMWVPGQIYVGPTPPDDTNVIWLQTS